jgi:hypothetical protein
MNKFTWTALIAMAMVSSHCGNHPSKTAEPKYYTDADYYTVKKSDVHVHINTAQTYFITFSAKENFRLIDLNVDAPGYPTIEQQRSFLIAHTKQFPQQLKFCTTFRTDNGFEEPGWQQKTLQYLQSSFDSGAIGVKFWKNIGMTLRDKSGKFIMIDDERFDPVIDFIAKSGKTVVGHLGEPKNCWLPLPEMTVNNDRAYFTAHPEYHMFLHPEYPSYEAQVAARDHMLSKHPGLRFDGAHLGSLEWSVDELASRLDRFPDMAVDLAARLCHLQYQSLNNYDKVRNFFIKYQDRLLYATDLEVNDSMKDTTAVMKHIHDVRFSHWRYLTSADTLTTPEVNGTLKGLHLPADVVDKIYLKNAEKWFPAFK